MQLIVYDGSFEGFLTAVFEVYEYKWMEVEFARTGHYQENIFGAVHMVITDEKKWRRVWRGLGERISAKAKADLFRTFLSERQNIEDVLLAYIRYVFSARKPMEYDMSNPAVLTVVQTARQVHREKHRMEAFVRFQLTKDDLYYAVIAPDFDVLPLIQKHFQQRYADQTWLIFDSRRKYGIYYDMKQTSMVSLHFSEEAGNGETIRTIYHGEEELYQKLWQQYFNSVNIAARKNTKLHIQHMPRRYWRYLTEKKVL